MFETMNEVIFLKAIIIAVCFMWAVTVFLMRSFYAERLENEYTPKAFMGGYTCYVVSRDIKEQYEIGDDYEGGEVVEGFTRASYVESPLDGLIEREHVLVVRYAGLPLEMRDFV